MTEVPIDWFLYNRNIRHEKVNKTVDEGDDSYATTNNTISKQFSDNFYSYSLQLWATLFNPLEKL